MTTELEAINIMLSAIGEAPVADLDVDLVDVEMARNILTAATREVVTSPWRFNTEFGLSLDPAGTEGDLNTFDAPANLLDFSVTQTPDQHGLDLALRSGTFYDRVENRSGIDLDTLRIDAVFFYEFTAIPEVARRYVVVLATRRFIANVVGSRTLAGFTERDEYLALRSLQRQERVKEDLNVFNNLSVRRFFGRPAHTPIGTIDFRHT